jgi:hypothetical protein
MVVIAVDRDFDRFDDLLGLHTWSEVLLKPTREDLDKSSKVFWCRYNSDRLVQKHGMSTIAPGSSITAAQSSSIRLEAGRHSGTLVPGLEPQ